MAPIEEELEQAEREIASLRQRIEFLERSSDAILEYDLESRVFHCNVGATELFGYTLEELRDLRVVVPTDALDEALLALANLQPVEGDVSYRARRRTKDGQLISILGRATALDGTAPGSVSLMSVERPSTHSVKNPLLDREWFEITLSSIGDAVIATNAEGRVVFMNEVAERLTGWPFRDARMKELPEVFHIVNELTRKRVENPVEKVLRTDGVVGLANHTVLIAQDRTEFSIDDSGAPIRNEAGNIIGVVLIFRDITEKRKLEQQLIQTQRMEAIGHLAAGVAHDFNNILVPILGYAEMITTGNLPAQKIEEYAGNIISSSRLASRLIERILAVTRDSTDQTMAVSLKSTIDDVLSIVRASAPRSVAIHQQVEVGLPKVDGNPEQLAQIVLNLCMNAVQAMSDSGTLTVRVHLTGHHAPFINNPSYKPLVCIVVHDTGIGIPKHVLERMYEPFYTTRRRGEARGTGLGLSIVLNLIEQHQGFIEVETHLGKGTVFRVYLPALPEAGAPSAAETDAPGYMGQGETILVVDDDDQVRMLLVDMLEALEYNVVSFVDPKQALARFSASPDQFDVVITDLSMPDIGGNEVVGQITAIRPDIPTVITTGYTDLLTPANRQEWKCDELLAKPFQLNDCAQMLRRVLTRGERP
ncbi:MAG: PAS domain S-box protein [Gammaproteobacteria bacterium]|nr:PAS domain S-box protein [Gammaproteobacteria bacterium]